MNHTEELSRYVANFIDELTQNNLKHVVISPGSRSTPLAMLCCEHKKIKEWVLVDERSAAFFALGMAKRLKEPVALVCTSGTAAANYVPAVVEAFHSQIPLLVLTADRPHELRGIGASQTINQINMYGTYVKEFWEMALPDASPSMLRYVRNRAAKAIRIATEGNQGPVHMNFPFREPLVPNFQLDNLWGDREAPYNWSYQGKKQLTKEALQLLANKLTSSDKGLIVCGPQTNNELIDPIIALSNQLKIPILADPLSQLRAGKHEKYNIISSYDTMFRSKEIRGRLKPNYIIRFGSMPISKSYMFYLMDHKDCTQIVVEENQMMQEPTNHDSEYVFADATLLCEELMPFIHVQQETNWLRMWRNDEHSMRELLSGVSAKQVTEGEIARILCEELPGKSNLFVSNSMPVRDVDTFFVPTEGEMNVYASRGASGIDGVTSTALGMAAVSNTHMTLMIGDLSFYHDLNGLLASKWYELDILIILMNNHGGGIFSFLPQAKEEKHFETLFGTPLHLDFEKAVTMYGGNFVSVNTVDGFNEALHSMIVKKGLSVIEVCTERKSNAAWHHELWNQAEQRLIDNERDSKTYRTE